MDNLFRRFLHILVANSELSGNFNLKKERDRIVSKDTIK